MRRPRILLLTEFYPADPVTCVFGAFKRLRCHVEALSRLGRVDAVFFWPEHDMSADVTDRQSVLVKQSWPIDGRVRFIRAASGPRRALEWLTDVVWALRGAVGFFHTKATMRTCRHDQVVALRRCLQELRPDLIFVHRLGAFAPLLRMRDPLPPVVVDIDDLEHVKLARLAQTIPHFVRRTSIMAQAWLARHALRRAARKANRLLVTSELDRAKIETVCRGFDANNLPNGASSFGQLRRNPGPVACFVGTGAYPPNSEAILWLIREIWPRIHGAIPDARLLIAGEDTELLVADGIGKGIEGLGFVPDLASVYDQARLCVCPVRRGAGTRIKIIETAMNGRPTVSTTVGAEGLSLVPDTEILLGDTPEEFARAWISLLRDPDRAAGIGEAARRRVEAAHAPDRIADQLVALCAGLIQGVAAGPVRTNENTASKSTSEIGATL